MSHDREVQYNEQNGTRTHTEPKKTIHKNYKKVINGNLVVKNVRIGAICFNASKIEPNNMTFEWGRPIWAGKYPLVLNVDDYVSLEELPTDKWIVVVAAPRESARDFDARLQTLAESI
jgi:hypothetical protein